MKKLIFTLFFTALFLSLAAQNVESDRREMERILANRDNYVTGIGEHDTLEVAVHNAIAYYLAPQIETTVASKVDIDTDIQRFGRDVSEKAKVKIETTIFSEVKKLRGLNILTVREPSRKNNKYKVFVYIEKTILDKIYEEAKKEQLEALAAEAQKTADDVKYYYEEGCNAVKDLRIGDALKCWYCAYAMSLGNNDIKINGNPADRVLETEIDKVLSNIQVAAVSCQKEKLNESQAHYDVILDIRYKDSTSVWRKVTNLDYTYNDGYLPSSVNSARDGVGLITLRRDMNQVSLYCVYCYGEGEVSKDVYDRINGKKTKRFNSAEKTVTISSKAKQTKDVVVNTGEAVLPVSKLEPLAGTDIVTVAVRDHSELSLRMTRIEQAIRNLDAQPVKSLFTDEGYGCFEKLIMYGKATIIGKPQYKFLDYGTRTLCRGITMQFNFKRNKQFIEKVTFRFNSDNLVESVAFQLSDIAESDILYHGDWLQDSRLALMTFLEDYQTAYALRRDEYLESIFSANALIIIGNKVVVAKNVADRVKLVENVRYDTLSKTQYIKRLKDQFATREYINLNFLDTDFQQSTKGNELYGIRVKQEYFSSEYGDVGWLFLLVDLRGELPVIHVRAWQNEKLPLEYLVGLTDFY